MRKKGILQTNEKGVPYNQLSVIKTNTIHKTGVLTCTATIKWKEIQQHYTTYKIIVMYRSCFPDNKTAKLILNRKINPTKIKMKKSDGL